MRYFHESTANNRGMTLVELMVAIGVTLMVMALTVSIFTGQYKSHIKQSDVNEIQESTPPAVELLKRDLMSAGWSVRPEMGFYFEDGGSNGTDRIYVNDSTIIGEIDDFDNPNRNTVLAQEISKFMKEECSGCSQILNLYSIVNRIAKRDIDDEENDGDTTGKDFVKSVGLYIMTSSNPRVVMLGNTNSWQEYLNIDRFCSINNPNTYILFSSDTFIAPAIYYCVDDGNSDQCHPSGSPSQWVLRRGDRNSNGIQIMAESVVDLQVAYRNGNDDIWYGTSGCEDREDCYPTDGSGAINFNSDEIDLIRVTLVTRSAHRDKALSNNAAYCRPAIENRNGAAVGSNECGYTYRTYTIQVVPRNT